MHSLKVGPDLQMGPNARPDGTRGRVDLFPEERDSGPTWIGTQGTQYRSLEGGRREGAPRRRCREGVLTACASVG